MGLVGYEQEFTRMAAATELAAARVQRRLAQTDNMSPVVRLHHFESKSRQKHDEVRTSTDQFLLAAMDAPQKYTSRLQKSRYQGSSARKEAEAMDAVAGEPPDGYSSSHGPASEKPDLEEEQARCTTVCEPSADSLPGWPALRKGLHPPATSLRKAKASWRSGVPERSSVARLV